MNDHPTLIIHKDEMPILVEFICVCHLRGLNPGLETIELMRQQLAAWQRQPQKESDHA